MSEQEVIIQCCVCNVIKKDDEWTHEVVVYQEDTKNISSTYCPKCFKEAMAQVDKDFGEKK
jgi:hypothetical protein